LVEVEENSRAARLLGLPPLKNSPNVLQEFSPTLSVLTTSGAAALEEYLYLIIPMRRLVRMLVESRPYQYFVAAAPGLKELLTIGKVWYEERRRDVETQAPWWDLLVVDLPATGHGLQYLHMPCAARDTFGDGIVHREAERIVAWLQDPDKTAVNLVTTVEELPVSETLDANQQLTEKLQLPLGALFINQVHEAPLSLRKLTRLHPQGKGSNRDRRLAELVLACAKSEAALVKTQEIGLAQLRQTALPSISLPFYFSQEFGLAQLEQLSQQIETALDFQREDFSTRGRQRREKIVRP
jgi:anion-transporting  ArsA/GET3 family ATPase